MTPFKHFVTNLSLAKVYFNFRTYSVSIVLSKVSTEALKNDTNDLNPKIHISPYYFEDGLRKVYPYVHELHTYCKGRWLKSKISDLYFKEFTVYTKEEIEDRLYKGLIKVNNKVVDAEYVLKEKDIISTYLHKHELPVLACPIDILYEDDDFLVVNKPPSIPVHACGLYVNNCLLSILENDHKKSNLFIIYRLDRLTSGVLMFAKSKDKSRELHEEVSLRSVSKEYVCRVEGNFPDDSVVCNKPMKMFHHKIGLSLVHSAGKVAMTEFKKLSYNGKSSVVLCRPLTGRTHQIRVHLQYLGYPIVNDPIYNNKVFGKFYSLKGQNGEIEKPISQLLEDLLQDQYSEWGIIKSHRDKDFPKEKNYLSYTIFKENYSNTEFTESEKDDSRFTYNENCYFCKTNPFPEQGSLGIFLHAYKYKTENWSFEAPLPFWAAQEWNIA